MLNSELLNLAKTTTTAITKQEIEDTYILERKIAETKMAKIGKVWVHTPKFHVLFTNRKTAFGFASSNGSVKINNAFIGTNDRKKLVDTIRHELAHLAAGLSNRHNAVFKHFAIMFGARPKAAGRSDEVANNIGHKYELYAVLENGTEQFVKTAHRKSPKYANYKHTPGAGQYYSIKGVKIDGFKYKKV